MLGRPVRYLVIKYSTHEQDDIGPVLVYTYDYFLFYEVGKPHGEPLPVIGYEIIDWLRDAFTATDAVQIFYEKYVPLDALLERSAAV